MEQIYGWKQQWLEIYTSKSRYIDMGLKFIVAIAMLLYINSQLGFMSMLNNIVVVLGLAVVCSILPFGGIMTIALLVILLHTFELSMVLAGAMAIVFLMLFIVYFRFTSELSLVVILTPISLALGMPAAAPIVCGLLVGPVAIIPMSVAAIVYSLISVIGGMSDSLNGELSLTGIMEDGLLFVSEVMDNKEMIFYIVLFAVVTTIVFIIRKLQVPHAWKIAIATGFVVAVIFSIVLNGVLSTDISMLVIFLGNLVAVAIGFGVELFFLGVDYKRTEMVEFEDDEYRYYVKMIPKSTGNVKHRRRRTIEQPALEEEMVDETQETEVDPEIEEELAYVMDEEVEQGSTVIIDSDDIERELRSNAHEKSMQSEENKTRHSEANYKMLKNAMNGRKRDRR